MKYPIRASETETNRKVRYGFRRKSPRQHNDALTYKEVIDLKRLSLVPRHKLSRKERRKLDRINFKLRMKNILQSKSGVKPNKSVFKQF